MMGTEPASVRPCICMSTLSNINISETSWPIAIKFYLKQHWVVRKAALGFGADRCITPLYMATDSFHRVIMGKTVSPLFSVVFHPIPFKRTCMKSRTISKFSQIRQPTAELDCQSSLLYLQLTRTCYNLERVRNSARSDNQAALEPVKKYP